MACSATAGAASTPPVCSVRPGICGTLYPLGMGRSRSMGGDFDPDGRRLPIKVDSTSNGEFAPIPLTPDLKRANALASERAGEAARRVGVGRRAFLISGCGAAATLLALNEAHRLAGRTGGFFDLSPEAAHEPQLAAAQLGKNEFIFDVQGHFVNPTGAWLKTVPAGSRPWQFEKTQCSLAEEPGERSYLKCIGPDEFIKDVFMDSDTDLMVLSFVPSTRAGEPLTIEEAVATARIVEKLEGTHRLLIHGRVNPNQAGDLEGMDELRSEEHTSELQSLRHLVCRLL